METWRWRETPRPTCAMEHKKKKGNSIRKGQISIKKETCRQQDGDMEMEGDPPSHLRHGA